MAAAFLTFSSLPFFPLLNPVTHWFPLTPLQPHLLFTSGAKDDWHFILQLRGTTKAQKTEKMEPGCNIQRRNSEGILYLPASVAPGQDREVCAYMVERETLTVRINSDRPFDA